MTVQELRERIEGMPDNAEVQVHLGFAGGARWEASLGEIVNDMGGRLIINVDLEVRD